MGVLTLMRPEAEVVPVLSLADYNPSIGFTGSRAGMTHLQKLTLLRLFLAQLKPNKTLSLHHGCCIGADQQAVSVAAYLDIHCVAHMPEKRLYISNAAYDLSAQIYPGVKDYLERDRDIVRESQRMYAAPSGFDEVRRSGTWFTIRYARRINKPITIIYPDGATEDY